MRSMASPRVRTATCSARPWSRTGACRDSSSRSEQPQPQCQPLCTRPQCTRTPPPLSQRRRRGLRVQHLRQRRAPGALLPAVAARRRCLLPHQRNYHLAGGHGPRVSRLRHAAARRARAGPREPRTDPGEEWAREWRGGGRSRRGFRGSHVEEGEVPVELAWSAGGVSVCATVVMCLRGATWSCMRHSSSALAGRCDARAPPALPRRPVRPARVRALGSHPLLSRRLAGCAIAAAAAVRAAVRHPCGMSDALPLLPPPRSAPRPGAPRCRRVVRAAEERRRLPALPPAGAGRPCAHRGRRARQQLLWLLHEPVRGRRALAVSALPFYDHRPVPPAAAAIRGRPRRQRPCGRASPRRPLRRGPLPSSGERTWARRPSQPCRYACRG